mmetsp:Transcript_9325/g.8961  ORF Transcript_9325/g.8961 Transcript_9325/m.8961 type:complete len:681 (-) Transcript_9325:226-2268(-)
MLQKQMSMMMRNSRSSSLFDSSSNTSSGGDGATLSSELLETNNKAEEEANNNKMKMSSSSYSYSANSNSSISKEDLAWLFVNKINDRHKRIASSPKGNPAVSTFVSAEDMVVLTEKFLDCQDFFRKCNSPDDVTLTYHYTNRQAMNNIQQNGLMTLAEQNKKQNTHNNDKNNNAASSNKQNTNGATYGHGIYTATNPFAFSDRYGELGLIVAVIKGKTERVKENAIPSSSHTTTSNISAADTGDQQQLSSTNTVIGNKLSDRQQPVPLVDSNEFFDEVVLQDSSQCLPLVQFSSSLVSKTEDNSIGNNTIWAYHRELQRVVDTFFNGGSHTDLYRIVPSMNIYVPLTPTKIQHIFQHFKSSLNQKLELQNNNNNDNNNNDDKDNNNNDNNCYSSRSGLHRPFHSHNNNNNNNESLKRKITTTDDTRISKICRQLPLFPMRVVKIIKYNAPEILNGEIKSCYFRKATTTSIDKKAICPICMENLIDSNVTTTNNAVASMAVCAHQFHRPCIEQSLRRSHSCPVCRKNIREPQGISPSGIMTITVSSKTCSGFESCRQSIGISYNLPNGIQKAYHENPGQHYTGSKRQAFLPNNEEGRKLLERLKYSWLKGLTFRVGTSLTTGRSNCIVWSSIHHKTSRTGGLLAHGFPDNRYFTSCNEKLNSLGVPPAAGCYSNNCKNMLH